MLSNPDNSSDSDATTDLNDRRQSERLDPSVADDPLAMSFEESSLGPSLIGRYRILKELGHGAFGRVYQALDETLNRHVAIKLLTKFDDVNQLEGWLSEARVLAGLDHPSIVPIFDVGRTDLGQPYIVSKLIEGGSLSARRGDKEWTLKDSVRVVLQLSKALEYLHSRGVVHRDIKPGNILTTTEGNAVLADFGLAMAEESYGKGSRFVGTPAYMSPEQARLEGHRVDGRSDIYSLGVVFYELISGTRPFAAKDREELLDCIRSVEVRPLRQLRPEVPRELERICLKMLSKKVSDRYTTAGDLSEELLDWDSSSTQLQSKESIAVEPASTYVSSDTVQPTEQQSNARTLDIETVAVVPHGLRPFDTNDADFFRYLLPGARNRDGVPESITFWVNRIVSRNEGQTFRNGVLMGPSGSGKSSLMRAGVLPLVDNEVISIYLEAKPESLEKDLAKQIRQHFAFLGGKESLQETLTRVRQHISARRAKKLVLIVDQFEQWLNVHRDEQSTDFHESLRQCDGVNLQAILLVRDDFMVGLSSFLEQVEELLLQNQNFATVEPFGVSHAQKVLAAFGRAYGAVKDPPTPQQSEFIRLAVDELHTMGRLEPVQLTLLSEMVKDKEWSAQTLSSLGGIEGLGSAFLEERLGGISAHPFLRMNLPAVRRILSELLPSDNNVIKAVACPQSVLLDRVEGIATEGNVRKLLHLLDTEVRLITPTSGSNTSSTNSTSSSADPAYQLTHDYLVPAIRKWLAAIEVSTRAGRARNQLREIATAWNAKPSARRLPSLSEWLAFRWFTPSKQWTKNEKRMMQSADRRLLGWSVTLAIGLSLLAGVTYYGFLELHSSSLAKRLVESDTRNVTQILAEIEPYRSRVAAKLLDMPSGTEDTKIQEKQKLHKALLLSNTNADQVKVLMEGLGAVEDEDLFEIIQYIQSHRMFAIEPFFESIDTELELRPATGLAMAAVVCSLDAANERWNSIIPLVGKELVRKPSTQIAFWPKLFRPIRVPLVQELLSIAEKSDKSVSESTLNVFSLVAAMAQDDATSIARAIRMAPVVQLAMLVQSCDSSVSLKTELRMQLAKSTASPEANVTDRTLSEKIESLLEGMDSMIGNGWVTAASVPAARLDDVLRSMKEIGYVPRTVRAFRNNDSTSACVVWKKDATDFIVETGMTSSELESRFHALAKEQFQMRDFSFWSQSVSPAQPSQSEPTWCGVWEKSEDGKRMQQVLLLDEATDSQAHPDRLKRLAGLQRNKYCDRLAENGDLLRSSLWCSSDAETLENATWSRLAYAAGDLFPGYCTQDIRCEDTNLANDRGNTFSEFLEFEALVEQKNANYARHVVNAVTRLAACGQSSQALAMLEKLLPTDYEKLPESEREAVQRGADRQYARIHARLGQTDALRDVLEKVVLPGRFTEEEKDYLSLRLALLERDSDLAKRLLTKLEENSNRSRLTRDYFLRALATVASMSDFGDAPADAFQKLLAFVPRWHNDEPNSIETLLEVDFDGLRGRPGWHSLLERLKVSCRFAVCSNADDRFESRAIFAEEQSAHDRTSKQFVAEGYYPICMHGHHETRGRVLSSIWHRTKESLEKIANRSKQNSNLCLAIAKLGETDSVLDVLNNQWGRSTASEVIANAPRILPPSLVVSMLRQSASPETQSQLVSLLGTFKPGDFQEQDFGYLKLRLSDWSALTSDASLRNHSLWCLEQWGIPATTWKTDSNKAKGNWIVNSVGQQMIVLEPPGVILVGRSEEKKQWVRIQRKFALGSTEVTGEQFEEFLRDPRVVAWIEEDRRQRYMRLADNVYPQASVSWQIAVQYCQWLNEREGIAESQWCYANVWKGNGKRFTVHSDYLKRTGYRLPTQAEWEFACSAGSAESWHFGSNDANTANYEWTSPHSNDQPHPVARLRPNSFGFFDMGGNLAEWTDDYRRTPLRSTEHYFVEDSGNVGEVNAAYRALCGGRYRLSAASAMTTMFAYFAPEHRSTSTGFRVARTVAP